MDIRFNENIDCFCGSGKKLINCCWSYGRIRPKSVGDIAPKGSFSNKDCYASELKGCSPKLSLEHYLSHAALKILAGDSGFLKVGGLKIDKPIPAKTFGSNILCTNHNSALSELDSRGVVFFEALHNVPSIFQNSIDVSSVAPTVVNGYDLERWFLKVLIGMACGVLDETKKNWKPPKWWLNILFGKRPMFEGTGLSCRSMPGQVIKNDNQIGIAPLWYTKSNPRELCGLLAKLDGLDFSFMMKSSAKRIGTYRPGVFQFNFKDGTDQQLILLGWDHPHPLTTISIEWNDNPPSEE
jgi:hypothetical protein